MYQALYRSERPEVFSEILGQDHIVRVLKNQINTDTVSHAYLFCGTRGTGKTSTARILAKAVNCLSDGERPCGVCENCLAIKNGTFLDVIEIDAASNNGVDNIRELRESVKYPPAAGRKKVYIIDEVHMLSTGASNALLKTLEEPPENVMFILATTDPQKLPQTILSRCMRLDFRRVPERELAAHMKAICDDRGVRITDGALHLLAANADGSVRDGLSILDQCLSGGDREIDRDLILDFLGTVSEEFFVNLTEKVLVHNVGDALFLLDGALRDGKDPKQIMKDWMSHYRCLLITKYIKNPEDMLNMSTENIEALREQSGRISLEEINDGILTLARTINDARYSTQPRVLLELAVATLADLGLSTKSERIEVKEAKPAQKAQTEPPRTVREEIRPAVKPEAKTGAQPQPVENPEKKEESPGRATKEPERPDVVKYGSGIPDTEPKEAEPDYNLDEIWHNIFRKAEKVRPSFNLVKTGASLGAIGKDSFKIIVRTEFVKNIIEKESRLLSEFMEEETGRKLKPVCRLEGMDSEEDSAEEKAREIAEEVKAKFHIDNVTVE